MDGQFFNIVNLLLFSPWDISFSFIMKVFIYIMKITCKKQKNRVIQAAMLEQGS